MFHLENLKLQRIAYTVISEIYRDNYNLLVDLELEEVKTITEMFLSFGTNLSKGNKD